MGGRATIKGSLGRSDRFEPIFWQNIHFWCMKIESVRSFPTRVFIFGSREAYFADHVKVHPQFEDDLWFEDDPGNEDKSAIFKISVLGEPSKAKNWLIMEKFQIGEGGSWPIHKKTELFYGFERGVSWWDSHPILIFFNRKRKSQKGEGTPLFKIHLAFRNPHLPGNYP